MKLLRPPSLLVLVCLATGMARPGVGEELETDPAPVTVAVIANPSNPVTDLKLGVLRSYMKLERREWPGKERCEVFLRPSRSTEMRVLLEEVYGMTGEELRKYWVGKIFRGEITAKPAVVPNAEAAGARVRDVTGALTVVLTDEVPEGVRILTIDGKRPGDPSYPLVLGSKETGRSSP